MGLHRIVFSLIVAVGLTGFQEQSRADAKVEESRDFQDSKEVAQQSSASIFNGLLESILAVRSGNPIAIDPKYKLAFSVGAGGKIVNTATGFECESECELALEDVLRATYEVIPNEDYQFAGWSGDICNKPDTYLNSSCDVSIGWSRLGTDGALRVKAQFARKANLDSATATAEFELSSYGIGGSGKTKCILSITYHNGAKVCIVGNIFCKVFRVDLSFRCS